MFRILSGIILGVSLAACSASPDRDRWTELFDGETLDGWFVHHGDLPFDVRDGEIVGATAVDIPTHYLTTNNQYDDFILELEMNNSTGENSGVQFRSVTDAPFYTGLTGYQLEVDPTERGWTGGIYFEGVGTWQHPPINNPACKKSWRKDGWNTLRIEAKGKQMRTFVNEIPCAYLFDEYLQKGHIGLQIHSIGSNPNAAGAETRWRNIRILENPKLNDYTADDIKADSNSHFIDRLSPVERALGWTLVRSNLKDASLWAKKQIRNPINLEAWTVNVATLRANSDVSSLRIPLAEASYHLIADMQIEPMTSGEILYPVTIVGADGEPHSCIASYRIFDDRSLEGRSEDSPMLMAALTGKIAAKNMSEPDRPKRVLFGNAWQRIGLNVQSGHVEHWLNAVKVVDYQGCRGGGDNEAKISPHIEIKIDTGAIQIRTLKMKTGSSA